MHEISDFYSMITFSYTKYFVHSYTEKVVLTLSYNIWYIVNRAHLMLWNWKRNYRYLEKETFKPLCEGLVRNNMKDATVVWTPY